MPSKRPVIMIRSTEEIIEKFKVVSKSEHRSMSNYAEKLILDKIDEYESKHGEIKLEAPDQEEE